MILSAEQNTAYKAAVDWWQQGSSRIFYLCGYAGTGKSTLLPHIIDDLKIHPVHPDEFLHKASRTRLIDAAHSGTPLAIFTAPTGQAALVMSRKFRDAGCDWQAMTLHKALYLPIAKTLQDYLHEVIRRTKSPIEADNYIQFITITADSALTPQQQQEKNYFMQQAHNSRARDNLRTKFQIKDLSPASLASLIVVDEASMVSGPIVRDLLASGARILAVGDPAQLPPIRSATALIDASTLPNASLTEVHRQALHNPIIHLATAIRNGFTLPADGFTTANHEVTVHPQKQVTINEIVSSRTSLDTSKEAILVGTNSSRWAITHHSRSIQYGSQYIDPQKGEPLVCTRNSYSMGRLVLVNGQQLQTIHSEPAHSGITNITVRLLADPDRTRPEKFPCLSRILQEYAANKFSVSPEKESRSIIQLDFAYAMTTHKFQGSQSKRIIGLDESRIFRQDANRWLYTLVTRAEESIELYQPT